MTNTNAADVKADQVATDNATALLGAILPDQSAAVTKAAKSILSTAKTLATRAANLGDALAEMHAAAESNGHTFRDYATAAHDAIVAAGDWSVVDLDTRKAIAAMVGTRGRLSSVMVADALSLSQSTANRVIRAAKSDHVDQVAEAAAAAVIAEAADQGHDTNAAEVVEAAEAAAESARVAAAAEADQVVTSSGYVTTSGRGDNATRAAKGSSVAKSLASTLAKVEALADGTVEAADVATLSAALIAAGEALAARVDGIRETVETKRRAEAAANAEAAVTKVEETNADRQSGKPYPATAKGVERAEAAAKAAETLAADLAAEGVDPAIVERAKAAAAVAGTIFKTTRADATDRAAGKAAKDASAWLAGTFGDEMAANLTDGKTNGEIVAMVAGLRSKAAELLAA
ncbi:hypothetical protein [Nocardioides panzhihuensis]|uniref:Uncharacterized protein n=1 Tax=Nocardioides panzhihuensis TaxID=860243 RepID=A0A7Z0DJP6_9ACTN|nr:hypothetical protein [Nocardioides panzhihuensis]NYI76635.1 hypothetical protein [Nocardioides panzhihuensis]